MSHRTLVLGSGPAAVRVLVRPKGCELRFGPRIVTGNADLARLLVLVQESPAGEGLAQFADAVGRPLEEVKTRVLRTLIELESVGVPRACWGVWWNEELQHFEQAAGRGA